MRIGGARAWAEQAIANLIARIVFARARTPFALLRPKHFERKLLVFRLGGRDLALANTPELAKRILSDREDVFPKAAVVGALLRPLIGRGLFGTAGPAVGPARRLFLKALAQVPDTHVDRVTTELTSAYGARWATAGMAEVPICEELARLTIDVVSTCLLDRRFDEADSRRFTELFFQFHQRADPIQLFLGRSRPALDRELEIIGDAMRGLIRRAFLAPLLADRGVAERAAFGRALIAEEWLGHEGSPDDERQERIVDELAVLLLAGHETTASTLSWLVYTLATRPGMQERLARALAAGEQAEADAFLDEALRLYPPIPFYARDVTAAAEMRERPIRAGGLAIVSPWTLHRHRALWSKPDEFLPERWREPGFRPQSGAYIPFAAGARACPGARFAMVEMRAIVRCLFGRYRVALAEAERPAPAPLGNLTARPDREIMVTIRPRAAGEAA